MTSKTAPFPQANDFEKVLKVLNVPNESLLSDYGRMAKYLGDISDRQVDYYVSACVYLGFIKDKKFTKLGKKTRSLTGVEQNAEVARIIVSDEIFGTVYFQTKMLGFDLDRGDVISIMREYVEFQSDPLYDRRSSTVISWIKWIISQEA